MIVRQFVKMQKDALFYHLIKRYQKSNFSLLISQFSSLCVNSEHHFEQAFLASSLKNDPELHQYFLDHLVWEDTEKIIKLMKEGLFVRLYAPQVKTSPVREHEHTLTSKNRYSLLVSTAIKFFNQK